MQEVVIIGAGLGGIGVAIKLREAGIEDFVLLERAGDRAGWRDSPVPIVLGGEEAPAMLGVALQTGVGADTIPDALPWSTTPLTPRAPGQVMSLTGRVSFRSEGAP